jgi:hypothetical protein
MAKDAIISRKKFGKYPKAQDWSLLTFAEGRTFTSSYMAK